VWGKKMYQETTNKELICIDRAISNYVLSEVRKSDYMFQGVFNKYLAIHSYQDKPFENGCFSETINRAYEDTIDLMRTKNQTKKSYLETIIKRFIK